MDKCIDKVCNDLLTPEELKRSKESIIGGVLLFSDDIESLMNTNSKNEIYYHKRFSI